MTDQRTAFEELVLGKKPAAPVAEVGGSRTPPGSYARAALDNEVRTVAAAQEGVRNDTLNKAAYSLGQLVGAGALAEFDVRAALHAAAGQCGLDWREAENTITSGLGDGIEEPRQIPDAGSRASSIEQPNTTGHRSWKPVDLSRVLDGTHKPSTPTVGRRSDGHGLFYPGKVHTISSESEAGKTWLVLSACQDEMRDDNHVIYLDFEDDESGIVGRLLALGVGREVIAQRFHYLRPVDAIGTGINLDDLHRVLAEYAPTLAILDGITEAMALHGLDPNKNDEVAAFGKMLPRRIADSGAAAVNLDHVTKDREGRGRWSIGAQHKLSGLDGAAYVLDNRSPFGVGLTGRSTIKVAKDRPGQIRRNGLPSSGGMYWYGDLTLTSRDETFAEVSIEPPHERDDDWRPTHLMAEISQLLTEKGPLAQRRILAGVGGKTDRKREALDMLILDGHVTEQTPHQLVNAYVLGVEST